MYIYMYIYIYIYVYIYVCMYLIYISDMQLAPEDCWCGFFTYRIHEEFHINLWECSMHGCYNQNWLFFVLKLNVWSHLMRPRV